MKEIGYEANAAENYITITVNYGAISPSRSY